MTTFYSGSSFGGLSFGDSYYYGAYSTELLERRHEQVLWQESTSLFDGTEENEINGEEGSAENFLTAIKEGKEDAAMEYYNELLATMKKQSRFSKYDNQDLKDKAKEYLQLKLKEMTGDEDIKLTNYIKKYTSDVTERKRQTERYAGTNVKIDETTTADILVAVCNKSEKDVIDERSDKTWGIGRFFRKFVAFHNRIWNSEGTV